MVTTTIAADKKEEDAVKKALQQVGEMVGEWKGNGKAKVGTKEQLWKETISLGWKFKGGESWIAVEFKDGKNFTSGDLKYILDKKFYRLTVTDGMRIQNGCDYPLTVTLKAEAQFGDGDSALRM